MKIILNPQRRPAGFVLLLVILLAAFTVIILTGVMNRTSTVSLLNLRSTQLSQLDSAAEAAVEKTYAQIACDFQANGPGYVTNNIASYRTLVPTTVDNAYWGNFTFSDPVSGVTSNVYINFEGTYTGPLPSQFTNQFAYNSPIYRIACNVKANSSLVPDVVGTAQEDILLALVPITTYAIFYNGQLEFSDCATMLVNGRVHSNTNICVGAGSSSTLTFNALVTATSTVTAPERGNVDYWTLTDPTTWLTTFNAGYTTNNPIVNIAIAMTNSHSIIDIPPPTSVEPVMSVQGEVRLYNEAQVVLVVTNSPNGGSPEVLLTLQSAYNGDLPGDDGSPDIYAMTNQTETALNTNLSNSKQIQLPFLSLTNTFVDQRQGSSSQYVTQIDINKYKTWAANNPIMTTKFTGNSVPDVLYVADRRNIGSSQQAVVRLVNGAELPYNQGLGFTVATQNPLYVEGNYNVTVGASNSYATTLGSTTNGASVPAALLSDAITILSPSWQDSQSSGGYSARNAANMTLNAALVTGNMPSTGTSATTYSGGVENLPRLLEDWAGPGAVLTLNTSIVCLYASQMATAQFQMPNNYYTAPKRNWGFDQTYYSPNKQPPGIPCALVPIRFNWSKPPPGGLAGN
jgi:hypothetical protein